jgi:starch synthase
MILLSHPTGNANVRHAALALQRAGLLDEFWTCLNYQDRSTLGRLLPKKISQQLRRRTNPAELQPHLRTCPFHEIMRLIAPRIGLDRLVRHERGLFSVDAIYRSLDQQVSRRLATRPFSGVYAYEDGAEESFRTATARGQLAIYDLPIGYWRAARRIMGEEAQLQPAWASTIAGNRDSTRKTDRKDNELGLANVVFVASSFTRRTLEEAAPFRASVVVVPYGAPIISNPGELSVRPAGAPLRVLFVGSLGQRKGLSYLFAARRMLGASIKLTVIGTRPAVACAALDRELGDDVRWISSCPHRQILAEMAEHDVFVFPSLFEGFGLVLLEAMAMGLPIITTPHTAGPDLIEDGREGFIVPIRDAAAIAEKLELLRNDSARLASMREAARVRARTFAWKDYEARLAACVRTALS